MSCSTVCPTPPDGRPERSPLHRGGVHGAVALLTASCCLAAVVGCRTSAFAARPDAAALAAAVEELGRPLSGDMAALYHLRVPSSGALRLAVVESGSGGRMTVSEPFGSALSITVWGAGEPTRFFDLRHGCRADDAGVAAALGVGAMPMPQAVRLLGGRLPAVGGDRVVTRDDGRVEVVGAGWRAMVSLAASPWRVTEVEELRSDGRRGWRVELGHHTASVPGTVRIDGADRGWAELELVRLQWDVGDGDLPEPELPPCAGESDDAT